MSIEAGVVIDENGNALHWHLPPGRDGGALPDSPNLWKVLWENRERITGFAHSHPGSGLTGPSSTDITTFAAVEQGLGTRLDWFICSSDRLVLVHWVGPGVHTYKTWEYKPFRSDELSWLPRLRELSNYFTERHTADVAVTLVREEHSPEDLQVTGVKNRSLLTGLDNDDK
jgi:hypothetical protein